MLCGLPVRHFVHNYTHNLKTKGRTQSLYLRDTTIPPDGDILPIERLFYYRRYLFSSLELYVRYDRRGMDPNPQRNHLAIRRFVGTYTRNSKRIGCMRTLHISNDCSTIGDVYFPC